MSEFTEKTAIITGAGSGIGKATALAFGKEGAKIVVADINLDSAGKVADEIGDLALAFKVDVGDEKQCQACSYRTY